MEKQIFKQELIRFGKRVRSLRKARNKTQLDLEVDCKINHGDISRIENGLTNIEFQTIVRLAIALKVDIEELFKKDAD